MQNNVFARSLVDCVTMTAMPSGVVHHVFSENLTILIQS